MVQLPAARMKVVGYEAPPEWERVRVTGVRMTATTIPNLHPPPVRSDGFHRIHERRWQRNKIATSTKAFAASDPRGKDPFPQSRPLLGFLLLRVKDLVWILCLGREFRL